MWSQSIAAITIFSFPVNDMPARAMCLTAILLISRPTVAADWYVGAGAGFAHHQTLSVRDIDDGSFTDSSGNATARSEDDNSLALRAFVGTSLSERLSVELGYSDLGSSRVTGISNGCCVWDAGEVSREKKVSGPDASAAIKFALGQFVAAGKLGIMVQSGVNPLAGVSLSWRMFRVEFTQYKVDPGSVAVLWASIVAPL